MDFRLRKFLGKDLAFFYQTKYAQQEACLLHGRSIDFSLSLAISVDLPDL